MAPAKYNLEINQRATFRRQFRLRDSNGDPIFEAGDEFFAQFWDDKRRTLFAEFEITVIDLLTGTIELSLPFTVPRGLTSPGVWDLLLVRSNGDRQYILEGFVTIDPGYTDTNGV